MDWKPSKSRIAKWSTRTPVSRSMVAMSSGGPPKEKAAFSLAFPWPWIGTQASRGNETR
jgi:hypothetical protein